MKKQMLSMILAVSILTTQMSSSVYAMGLLDKIGETFSEENINAVKDQASDFLEENVGPVKDQAADFLDEKLGAAKDQAGTLLEEGKKAAGEKWESLQGSIREKIDSIIDSEILESLYPNAVTVFGMSEKETIAYWKGIFVDLAESVGADKSDAKKWWDKAMKFAKKHDIDVVTFSKLIIATFLSLCDKDEFITEQANQYLFDNLWSKLLLEVQEGVDLVDELEQMIKDLAK